jgi:hypothetical protein
LTLRNGEGRGDSRRTVCERKIIWERVSDEVTRGEQGEGGRARDKGTLGEHVRVEMTL